MDQNAIIRNTLISRLGTFIQNKEESRINKYGSPIYDILNVAIIFGIYELVIDMALNNARVMSKKAWSTLIWDRAWRLEDANWRASNVVQKDNDLLVNVMGDTKYLTWWLISDMDYRLINMCEIMSKILCHASLLKRDDFRLKGLSMSYRTCIMCEMYCIEDIGHMHYYPMSLLLSRKK